MATMFRNLNPYRQPGMPQPTMAKAAVELPFEPVDTGTKPAPSVSKLPPEARARWENRSMLGMGPQPTQSDLPPSVLARMQTADAGDMAGIPVGETAAGPGFDPQPLDRVQRPLSPGGSFKGTGTATPSTAATTSFNASKPAPTTYTPPMTTTATVNRPVVDPALRAERLRTRRGFGRLMRQ